MTTLLPVKTRTLPAKTNHPRKEYQPPPRRPPPQKIKNENGPPVQAQTYTPDSGADQSDSVSQSFNTFRPKPDFIPSTRTQQGQNGNPSQGSPNQRRGPPRQSSNGDSEKVPSFPRTNTDFDSDDSQKSNFHPPRMNNRPPKRPVSNDDDDFSSQRNSNTQFQNRNNGNDQSSPPSFAIPQRARPNRFTTGFRFQ